MSGEYRIGGKKGEVGGKDAYQLILTENNHDFFEFSVYK